jgi:metallo-beta-lactamase family protein
MTISLSFLGAAEGVTGSRCLVEYNRNKWLIDCGLFQGPKVVRDLNRVEFQPDPSKIQKIILTHAHLDHSGYLPRIFREGYEGPVFCTEGTADLSRILLKDAAFLEEEFAKFANETKYSNHNPATPLFTAEDAINAIAHLETFTRDEWHALAQDVRFRFVRSGHIIGASSVQLEFKTNYHSKIVTFSGDVGHNRSFILRGPQEGIETDVLVVEGTYGDRRTDRTDVLEEFSAIYRRTMSRGGVLVIPAFAVGRAQEVTFIIRLLEDQGRIPVVPVVLDSPMSISAMDVCLNHPEDRLSASGSKDGNEFKPNMFEISATSDQSMMACMREGPMVVISASGMLNGGRILHHLKRRLPDSKNTILFCGYQAEGTKGRFLQENAGTLDELRIHHQSVRVAAEIATIDQLSAHADQEELLGWISQMRRMPKTVIVNHGAPESQKALATLIQKRFGIKAKTAYETRKFLIEL